MHTRAASDLAIPGRIVSAKYRLDSIIGQGGMGSVWAATHLGLNTQVAIKLVSRELIRSPEALRRFDAEAKAVAKLQSRHVVQVYDNGTLQDGTPYVVMELLEGEDVGKRVERGGAVPLIEARAILVQCCKALARAHSVGIVHRDIKPDNIFLAVSHDEEASVAKLLDFGIAKVAGEANLHSSTRTGAVLGTPLFMSPEQARGLKSIDHRTDIYSLGLVAYTMLTGKLAFTSESFGNLLLQICTQPLPSLLAAAPWLPPDMETWFQRACAREPAHRFQSVHELADGLRAIPAEAAGRAFLDHGGGPGSAMAPFAPGRANVPSPSYGARISAPRMVGPVSTSSAGAAHTPTAAAPGHTVSSTPHRWARHATETGGSTRSHLSMVHTGGPRRTGRVAIFALLAFALVGVVCAAVLAIGGARAPSTRATTTRPSDDTGAAVSVTRATVALTPSLVVTAVPASNPDAAATLAATIDAGAQVRGVVATPTARTSPKPAPTTTTTPTMGTTAMTTLPTTTPTRSVDLGY